jgi:dipeptide transport system substrate-binding protein
MTRNTGRTRSIVLRALAAAAALACASALAAPVKTLVFCSEGSPEGFDPAQYIAGTTFDASSEAIYDRLVEFAPGQTTVVPGLAEKWQVAPDGLAVTFTLRAGVKFHSTAAFQPTRDLDARDVVFSFQRMLDRHHPFHKAAAKGFPYADSMALDRVIGRVERVDDRTVRFVLLQPDATLLADLAMPFASILSAEYADRLAAQGAPDKLNSEPVGTGPFRLASYRKDQQIRYEAFDRYYAGRQKIDRLVFAITPDPSVRWQKLKAGECHVMVYPRPADIAAIRQDTRIKLLGQNGLNVAYLAYNTEKKPFDNRLVREALTLAIDKQAIVKAVYQGAGAVAKNPIPPTLWSYHDGIADTVHDPGKARALLREAGLEQGFATTLWAMPVQRGYNPNARQMAELIQADWAAIGVRATIVTYEWGEYLKRAKAGEHDTILLGWTGDNGDPDNFLYTLLGCDAAKSGENAARWCDKEFEDAVARARRLTDRKEREILYRRAQEIFRRELPWTPIAHSYVYEPARREVAGLVLSPFGLHKFSGVDFLQ